MIDVLIIQHIGTQRNVKLFPDSHSQLNIIREERNTNQTDRIYISQFLCCFGHRVHLEFIRRVENSTQDKLRDLMARVFSLRTSLPFPSRKDVTFKFLPELLCPVQLKS